MDKDILDADQTPALRRACEIYGPDQHPCCGNYDGQCLFEVEDYSTAESDILSTGKVMTSTHPTFENIKNNKHSVTKDKGPIKNFQQRVGAWLDKNFSSYESVVDLRTRNLQFLEEAAELVQALGLSEADAHRVVSYVYGRPVGDPPQEVGGVMVSLSALCHSTGLDMESAGNTELARIDCPEVVSIILEKHEAKQRFVNTNVDNSPSKKPYGWLSEEYITTRSDGTKLYRGQAFSTEKPSDMARNVISLYRES